MANTTPSSTGNGGPRTGWSSEALLWVSSRSASSHPASALFAESDRVFFTQNFVQKEEISEAIVQAMISQPGMSFCPSLR